MNANTINSKNVISGVNDLATKCPKISAMWSFKNTYTPSEVSVGTTRKRGSYAPIVSRSLKPVFSMSQGP